LEVYQGDDPRDVAQSFVKKYPELLNGSAAEMLEKEIER
jgi:hypothetical protein